MKFALAHVAGGVALGVAMALIQRWMVTPPQPKYVLGEFMTVERCLELSGDYYHDRQALMYAGGHVYSVGFGACGSGIKTVMLAKLDGDLHLCNEYGNCFRAKLEQ